MFYCLFVYGMYFALILIDKNKIKNLKDLNMTRGLYTSASGLIAEFSRMEVISNNLANVETRSFKKDIPIFKDYLKEAAFSTEPSDISYSPGMDKSIQRAANRLTKVSNVTTDWSVGPLRKTNDTSDIALGGSGFFKVLTPDGVRYTRGGYTSIDGDKNLIDTNRNYYLGSNDGKISLQAASTFSSNIRLTQDGSILLGKGTSAGKIKVVDFKKPYQLIKKGKGYYVLQDQKPGARDPREKASKTSVLQGYMEISNVNVVKEMVNMIDSMRTFESYQKMIQSVMTDTTQKAVNDLGRVRG